ncbi:uncharacterized protein METZ01_LOCUS206824, partial [marine metagenome]
VVLEIPSFRLLPAQGGPQLSARPQKRSLGYGSTALKA